MDAESLKEIKARTMALESYETEKQKLDTVELKLKRLYSRTHETVNGRSVKLTNRRKIAMAKALIENTFGGEIDITNDVANQLRVLDR